MLYLHATPETTWERTRHSKNRPLLQTADPLARARQLYAQRDSLYRETADLVIDIDQQKSAHVLAFATTAAAMAAASGSSPRSRHCPVRGQARRLRS